MKSHSEWKRSAERRFKIGGGIVLAGFLTGFFGSATYNGHTPPGIIPTVGLLMVVGGFVYLLLGIFDD